MGIIEGFNILKELLSNFKEGCNTLKQVSPNKLILQINILPRNYHYESKNTDKLDKYVAARKDVSEYIPDETIKWTQEVCSQYSNGKGFITLAQRVPSHLNNARIITNPAELFLPEEKKIILPQNNVIRNESNLIVVPASLEDWTLKPAGWLKGYPNMLSGYFQGVENKFGYQGHLAILSHKNEPTTVIKIRNSNPEGF